MEYLVIIGAIFALSVASSITRKGFSTSIFLLAVIISINVLVWQEMLPYWTIILCLLLVAGIFFSDNTGDDSDE